MGNRRVVLALLAVTAAWAAPRMDRSKHRSSGVTGVEAQVDGYARPDTDTDTAISGIGLEVKKGKACRLMAQVKNLPESTNALDTWWLEVGNASCTADADRNERMVERAGNYFVRGVKVCTQSTATTSERSIRGVKLFYARIKKDGTLEVMDDPEVWVADTGCEKWEERAMCPDGMVAVGVRGHKSDWGYRALALKCAAVTSTD